MAKKSRINMVLMSRSQSNQEGIRSPLSHAATAGARDPPTLADSDTRGDGNAFTSSSSCSFLVQEHERPGDGGGVAYEKDDDCSFPVLHPHAISMPTGRIH